MKTKVIAEIGWNHMGDMNLAKKMIDLAYDSGCEFAKFQTWSVDRLTSGSWDSDGRREIYENAELSLDQHILLKNYCESQKIKFLSSAFSIKDAELLNSIGCKEIKIPSFECTNTPLINYCQKNFNLIIISTGTANYAELIKLKEIIDQEKTVVMHCVSSYPCFYENANLPRINELKKLFKRVGYSDHTQGITASCVSLEYEVEYIEKHFTTDNELPGRDNKFALLPQEVKELVQFINNRIDAKKFLGIDYQEIENDSRTNYRKRFDSVGLT